MFSCLRFTSVVPFTTYSPQCVARKVPELCKAYTPGKADQDMNARITRLEHIIQTALPQYWPSTSSAPSSSHARTPIDRKRSPSTGDDDNKSLVEENDPIGGTFHSGKWYGNSASGCVAPSSVLEQVRLFFHIIGRVSECIQVEKCGRVFTTRSQGGGLSDSCLQP